MSKPRTRRSPSPSAVVDAPTVPRKAPYIWVTWLVRLLSGENHCSWAAWFKAHYTFQKVPSNFDSAAWSAAHNDLLQQRVATLTADGWRCYVENQNKFTIEGEVATLAGKIDILAVRGDAGLIVDCKTGQRKDADYQQMLVYLMVAPLGLAHAKGLTLSGEVQYRDGVVPVRTEELTAAVRDRIVGAIRMAGEATAPARVPSWGECRFCDVSSADCPERLERTQTSSAGGMF